MICRLTCDWQPIYAILFDAAIANRENPASHLWRLLTSMMISLSDL
jgi:hypothetical protein